VAIDGPLCLLRGGWRVRERPRREYGGRPGLIRSAGECGSWPLSWRPLGRGSRHVSGPCAPTNRGGIPTVGGLARVRSCSLLVWSARSIPAEPPTRVSGPGAQRRRPSEFLGLGEDLSDAPLDRPCFHVSSSRNNETREVAEFEMTAFVAVPVFRYPTLARTAAGVKGCLHARFVPARPVKDAAKEPLWPQKHPNQRGSCVRQPSDGPGPEFVAGKVHESIPCVTESGWVFLRLWLSM